MGLSGTLVAYWKLDETGTGTRADATGNGLTLTNNNSVTNATGKLNAAAGFVRASSQSLTRADEALLRTGDIDWHWQGWLYLDSVDNAYIAAKTEEWGLFLNNNGRLDFFWNDFAKTVSWGSNLTTGTWYHIVIWHDAVNDVVGIVVNDGTPVTSAYSGGGTTTTNAFGLGDRPGSGAYLNGRLDEVSMGKFVPTAGDITLYYGGGTPPGYDTLAGASTYTATAALTTAPATTAVAATSDPPTFSGSSALATAPTTLSAAGTTDPPVFSGSAALVAAPATLAAAGTTDPPVFSATAALAAGPATSSSTGAATPPTFTATAALSAAAAVLAASATYGTASAVFPSGGLIAREGYALRAREGYALTVREGYSLRAREG